MSYQFEKHFTLQEANELLPTVRRLFEEVHSILHPADPADHPPFSDSNKSNGNGNGNGNGHGHKAPSDYSHWSPEKRREAAYRLLNALQERGIVIQDVERGLIDFPAIVDNNEVFLCYELRDGHVIEYFHDLDAGFAGRQKITELPR